jgi:hypothetical protein
LRRSSRSREELREVALREEHGADERLVVHPQQLFDLRGRFGRLVGDAEPLAGRVIVALELDGGLTLARRGAVDSVAPAVRRELELHLQAVVALRDQLLHGVTDSGHLAEERVRDRVD